MIIVAIVFLIALPVHLVREHKKRKAEIEAKKKDATYVRLFR